MHPLNWPHCLMLESCTSHWTSSGPALLLTLYIYMYMFFSCDAAYWYKMLGETVYMHLSVKTLWVTVQLHTTAQEWPIHVHERAVDVYVKFLFFIFSHFRELIDELQAKVQWTFHFKTAACLSVTILHCSPTCTGILVQYWMPCGLAQNFACTWLSCLNQMTGSIAEHILHHIDWFMVINYRVFCPQANDVYDTEHAESIQRGQHIQPSANGFLLAPGKAFSTVLGTTNK